jgi:parallel beta-helix repeat protein
MNKSRTIAFVTNKLKSTRKSLGSEYALRWAAGVVKAASAAGLAIGMLLQPSLVAAAPAAVDPRTIDLAYAQSLAGAGQQVHVVTSSIQAAVNAATPGDVVYVPPGTYRENVQVRRSGLTIVGSRDAILDGAGLAGALGIDVRPAAPSSGLADFTLVGLSVQNYARTGVILRNVSNYNLLSTQYRNNVEYGLFPIRSTNGVIEGNSVSGSNDSGIYIGQSTAAIIRNNMAFDNTIGIELENSIGISVLGNSVERNTVGVFGVVLPGLSIPASERLVVTGNTIFNNGRFNPVTDPTEVISRLPYGVGLLFLSTDMTTVSGNMITDNGSIGIGLLSLPADLASLDPRVDPNPDYNRFFDNLVVGNGTNPDPKLGLLGLPPVDILWDGTGTRNAWLNNEFGTSYPEDLPYAIPEPAAWVMMLVGFGAIGFAVRRRKDRRTLPDVVAWRPLEGF